MKKQVVIVGGGFAGFNAARILGNKADIEITLIDRKNYHLFQPLQFAFQWIEHLWNSEIWNKLRVWHKDQ